MKNFTAVTGIGILLFLSCNTPEKETQPQDSTAKKPADTVAITGDNIVKSEAPDASTKMDQGYGLSRHSNEMAQSPINIVSLDATNDKTKTIAIKFKADITVAENLGHTIQLDFKDGSTTIVDGKNYAAKQFHFHTPSEHLIDGMTFPMEMHIVNILKDSGEKTNPSYLVIGVLFKMGKENKFIKEFLNHVPTEEHQKDSLSPGTVNFQDLSSQILGNANTSYFTYKGSLTTPPFTERVEWIVLKQILEASPDQILAIEKMEGNNARHVQALNDRKVLSH